MKKENLFRILIMLIMIFVYRNSNAQCEPAGNGTNGSIHCMYSDSAHNYLYVGGGFHNSGSVMMNYCGYWNDTTYFPMTMGVNNGSNDSVWCYTMFNGNIYAGGDFTQVGGVACNHIARWDGTSWHAVGNGFNQSVHALAVYNNQLYAGGEFTTSGISSVNHIGKWNGSEWNMVNVGTNDDVETMVIWNNAMYIGGDFTMAGGIIVNRICKWDGINVSAVGDGFNAGMMGGQCMVHSLCVYNGNLFAGGMFGQAGTMSMQNLAMWNGLAWSSVGNISGAMMGANIVSALGVYNGKLFVGGNFGSCGSLSANNLGIWNGSSWSNIGTGMNGKVNSLAVYHNALYIAGSFSDAAGTSVNNISKYSTSAGIETMYANTNFLNVYPNPAGTYISVSTNSKFIGSTYTISDQLGRSVLIGKLTSEKTTIDLSQLTTGTYLIKAIGLSEQAFKVIKK